MIECACLPRRAAWKNFLFGPVRVDYCHLTERHLRNVPKILSLGASSLAEIEYEEQAWLHGLTL